MNYKTDARENKYFEKTRGLALYGNYQINKYLNQILPSTNIELKIMASSFSKENRHVQYKRTHT